MADESKTDASPYTDAPKTLLDETVPDPEDTLGGKTGQEEPPHPGLIRHILTSLRPGQDLTRVTIPSFFLEDRSLLEKLTDTMMHPDLILQVPKIADPAARMVQMVQWYLSGWHYKTIGVKKPYNPIIGETFACAWRHEDGSNSQYIAEQVSHRPPVSAMYFENRQANLVINAQVWTKSKFKAPQTAVSILAGAADVHVLNYDEVYRLTMPTYYAHGLLFGTLHTEIGDATQIVCAKSGFKAEITFHQKPMFRGEYHRVTGTIINTNTGAKVYTFTGKWNEDFKIKNLSTKKETPWFDTRTLKVAAKYVLPLEKQGPWESRRLWSKVTAALHRRPTVDWGEVDREKSVLEEAQRELAVHSDKGGEWNTKVFHQRRVYDSIEGKEDTMYVFDHINTKPYDSKEPICNLVWLSQTLRDERTPGDTTGAVAAAADASGSGAGAGAGAGTSGSGAGSAGGADAGAAAAGGEGEGDAAAAAGGDGAA